MKLIIDIDENVYNACNEYKDNVLLGILQKILYTAISNGIPVEEFDNPCIYCGDNCCGAEYEDKRCECQKVFMIKENKK